MSQLQAAKSTFFFASILHNNLVKEDYIIDQIFKDKSNGIIFRSNFFPMKSYYSNEMGDEKLLSRFLILIPELYDRRKLVDDKRWADLIEKNHSDSNKRNINIDVGYQSLEQIVLATGKQFSHRIYIDHGVYIDLNLIYEGTSYRSLPWTYPDYSHDEFKNFFNWSRNLLLKQLNNS